MFISLNPLFKHRGLVILCSEKVVKTKHLLSVHHAEHSVIRKSVSERFLHLERQFWTLDAGNGTGKRAGVI